jgi:hypothetical protein
MPSLFETVVLNANGHENVPESDVPYYLAAQDGPFFLVKPTEIGQVILPERSTPKHMPKLGFAGGVFTWQGPKIPGHIISQAHHFFLRIFTEHHAEAEVLITKHRETGEFRLFVPYQRVSHAGVKSIYEPTHVSREYTVVGTLHSHCDFSAFHSGTDSGDASDMDGVHFTIGQVTKETPEIVSMVAMNGKEFHYKEPSDIADVEFGTQTAPPWWDQYVFAKNDAPRIKPKSLISLTQEHWDEFLGRALVKPKPITTMPPHVVRAPSTWDKAPKWERDDNDWRKWVYGGGRPTSDPTQLSANWTSTDPRIDMALDTAETAGLLQPDEWDDVKDADRDEIGYWQGYLFNKMASLLDTLEILDVHFLVSRTTAPTNKPTKRGKK